MAIDLRGIYLLLEGLYSMQLHAKWPQKIPKGPSKRTYMYKITLSSLLKAKPGITQCKLKTADHTG